MEIRVLHLYYDLMNLYGEYANVSVLERFLLQQGADVRIDRLSLYDEVDFSVYDFVYIGSATERKQLIALENIMKYKSQIKDAYQNGTAFLATGNAFELFGKNIKTPSGETLDCLGLFDFCTEVNDKQRTLEDQVCDGIFSEIKAVGFINKASEIFGIETPMFKVVSGCGNNKNEATEGIAVNNFYGTHLTGPLLVKNPDIAEFFVKLLCNKKGIEFSGIDSENEKKAYKITLNALMERFAR